MMKDTLGLIFYGALALLALATVGYSIYGLVRAIRARDVRWISMECAFIVLLAALCILALGSELRSGSNLSWLLR